MTFPGGARVPWVPRWLRHWLPLCKFRKNYVSAVRITLLTWKIPLRRCRFHLPLRRNRRSDGSVAIGSNPIFCRSAVGGQPISVLVTSSLCIRKDVSSISVLTRNGNGSYGTEVLRKNGNGTTACTSQRHNGTAKRNGNRMVETRHYKPLLTPVPVLSLRRGSMLKQLHQLMKMWLLSFLMNRSPCSWVVDVVSAAETSTISL